MNPFRQLLKHNAPFEWTSELENLIQISKKAIIKDIEHGVRQAGQKLALDFGCFKSIVHALDKIHFAAHQAGKSHLSGVDSPIHPE